MEKKKTNIHLGQGNTSRMNHRTLVLPPGLAYDVAKKLKLYEEMAKIWGAHDKYEKNVTYKELPKADKDKHKTCGECGYFMRFVKDDGKPYSQGHCASIGMNKECLDGINPFREDDEILQVEENEEACGYFKVNRPVRVRKYIKDNPIYSNKRSKRQ